MNIVYRVGQSLYINLTNRCTAACKFCVRNRHDSVGDADSLWLESEPDSNAVLAELSKFGWESSPEIVFCGFGEPTLRLDVLLETAKVLKTEKPDVIIRVNTNGHANLIHRTDITPRFKGMVDILSVSLNYPDQRRYYENCVPEFGPEAHGALLEFAALAKRHVPRVILTVVDVISDEDIGVCRGMAERLGVEFRVRSEI